ncbi:CHAPERONIN [Salix koriyanagi]|uniref:CHAPERONIN n=1 Tax=Salix koriyanagi TaxID=2511006 RepID=A0A9Q0PFL5_9ROSI|nr:CHAPERONIN [Salix koriyanagi]
MALIANSAPRSSKTESYVDNKRKEDIRHANIKSACAVADAVRTSLGPKGMDKMISTANGEVIITNDGATILNKMEVLQPAAKMLVELSKSQDAAAGDGTTTVVVIAGSLLKQCLTLLSSGIHPTVISDSLHKASIKAVDVLTAMAVPLELTDRESLVKSAKNKSLCVVVIRNGERVGDLLDKYHKQSGKRLWDAKHEVVGLRRLSCQDSLEHGPRHAQGEINAGINVRKGQITNILEENVVQPLLVSTSAITLAAECVRMLLKIDDIVTVR